MARELTKVLRREGLTYYPDSRPGISRKRAGRGFSYIAPDGTRIDNGAERKRISALGIPPAYESVWICPKVNGHLQATGIDAATRKQYRYHPDWAALRAAKKFDALVDFGQALPRIRRRVSSNLNDDLGDESFAIAAVVKMLDTLSLRIGNDAYTATNNTFGATTLRNRHLSLSDSAAELKFTAKGHKKVKIVLTQKRLLKFFQKIDDLPGAQLFTYQDGDTVRPVTSDQVNAYMAEASGDQGYTAKTFRTWNGTLAAFEAALAAEETLTIKAMSQTAADELHNTPTIARKSYIHPKVIDLADLSQKDREEALHLANPTPTSGLRRSEQHLLGYLTSAS